MIGDKDFFEFIDIGCYILIWFKCEKCKFGGWLGRFWRLNIV